MEVAEPARKSYTREFKREAGRLGCVLVQLPSFFWPNRDNSDYLERLTGRLPGLAVADGIPGFWRALSEAFPDTRRQRCWVHMMRNILDKLPRAKQDRAHADLRRIYNAATKAEAVGRIVRFADTYRAHVPAVRCLLENQEDLLSFFDFPREHWRHIKTTNPIESPFSAVKSRVRRAKRMMQHWSALGLVYQLLKDQQTRWHRLTAWELTAEVIAGARYSDGIRIKTA